MLGRSNRCRLSLPRSCTWLAAAVFYSTTPTNHSANGLEQNLLQRAASVREKIGTMPSHDNLFYPSAYDKSNGIMRGFSNWIIPNRIMVGQYPGLKAKSIWKWACVENFRGHLPTTRQLFVPSPPIVNLSTIRLSICQFQIPNRFNHCCHNSSRQLMRKIGVFTFIVGVDAVGRA
jgi:hypothetical protein